MRRVSRRLLLSACAGAVLTGCLSTTLPLPPPDRPDVQRVADGVFRVSGSLPMAGTVFVRNERTELLYGETVEQLYEFDVRAEVGDFMSLWYEASDNSQFYGDRSQTISFQIGDRPIATPEAGTTPDAGGKRDGAP